ncbi:MAG: DUF5666 domain-containing protein [Gammaproteobacteria bacterium]
MNNLLLITRLFCFALLFLLSACGGGGGNGGGGDVQTEEAEPENTETEDKAASANGIVYGPIDRFGSMFVNGINFSTNNTDFFRGGVSAGESNFEIGDMVTIRGTLDPDSNTGAASSVSYQENVIGAVTRTKQNSSIEVLGQTVTTDGLTDQTGFSSFSGLQLGDIVEITGAADGNGFILASGIIFHASSPESRVRGRVKNLDSTAQTFEIGNLTVDYSSAGLLDVPGNELIDGLEVRVKSSQAVSGNILIAEIIRGFSTISGEENDRVEITGIINGIDTLGIFFIDTQPVEILSTTALTNGTAEDIQDGNQAEVEGRLNSNGVLLAEEVVFLPDTDTVVSANVNAIDIQNGTVTALGATATVNNLTRLVDKTGTASKTFSLAEVNLGDGIEIQGFIDESGKLVARKIKRFEPKTEVLIKGLAEDVDAAGSTVTVLGTTIILADDTWYEDINGDQTDKAGFLAGLEAGVSTIKATGAATNSDTFTASFIRLK